MADIISMFWIVVIFWLLIEFISNRINKSRKLVKIIDEFNNDK